MTGTTPSLVQKQPAITTKATIIDLLRASARERMARSRAKQKKDKRAAKRMIRESEAVMTIIDISQSNYHGGGGINILIDRNT